MIPQFSISVILLVGVTSVASVLEHTPTYLKTSTLV